MSRWCTLGALVLSAIGGMMSAHAEQAPAAESATEEGTPAAPKIATGDDTREWLQRQGSRKQASRTKQTLSGPAMSKVNQRYVDSFAQPIPSTPLRALTPAYRQ